MITVSRHVVCAVMIAGAWASSGVAADAQGFRITGTTTAQFVQLRPWVDDSISADSTTGTGQLRGSTRNVVVACDSAAAFCRYKHSANDPLSTLPLMQDLQVSGWGLGQGIQVYAHGRFRMAAGEARDIWPLIDDPFGLLAAYVQMDRDRFRARLGRQYVTNGFGFYNFDGGMLTLTPNPKLDVEAFGGWGLERGTNEPGTSKEMAAVEDIPPPSRGILFGADARYRPTNALAFAAAYQREGYADRGGLYQDRIAANGELRMGRWGNVTGDFQMDLATSFVNELRIQAQVPVQYGLTLLGNVRHYRPFFELWTIWGAFSPVPYDEANVGADYVTKDTRLSIAGRAGYRHYADAETGLESVPMREDGYTLEVNGLYRLKPSWLVNGTWRTQIGFGAARTDFDAGVRWEPMNRTIFAGAQVLYWQDVYEFRLGTGQVLGFALAGGATLRNDLRLILDGGVYRNTYGNFAPETNWSQTRANLRFEWTIGADPGMRHVTLGGPK